MVESVNASLASYYGDESNKYTSIMGFFARATPVMTPLVNEGFLGDFVVVVEGASDAAALWAVQERLSVNWSALGIVIVAANGKNNISRPAAIFAGFGIPTFLIWDGDKLKGKSEGATENRRLLKFCNETPVDYPTTSFSSRFACFENDLESMIKEAIGDQNFSNIVGQVQEQFNYESKKQLLKNGEGVSEVIFRIYESNKNLPVVENIAREVTTP